MKPPLVYYGGKQMMLKHILPYIPQHEIYVEPFAGGAAVFFAKKRVKVEVLNDNLDLIITFYKVLKTDFDSLNSLIQATLHSESDYHKSFSICRDPENYTELQVAWAVWIQCNMSFSRKMFGGFAFNDGRKDSSFAPRRTTWKKVLFTQLDESLSHTYLFNRSFEELPKIYNKKASFYFVDPPYLGSDCGHYKGWTEADEIKLMEWLETLKGKFLLCGYDNEIRKVYRKRNNWAFLSFEKALSVNGTANKGKTKTETLCANYPLKTNQLSIYD